MLGDRPTPPDSEFRHFMLKEIYEQPDVVQGCLEQYFSAGSIQTSTGCPIQLGWPATFYENLTEIQIVGCGTSLHASLVGQYLLEQVAGIPTRVRYASEFPDRPFPLTANTVTIAVTPSGEQEGTLKELAIA